MSVVPLGITDPQRPVFAGSGVCGEAGLILPEGTPRPVFDDDVWDFTEVVGLPVQMAGAVRRFDFAAIADPAGRQRAGLRHAGASARGGRAAAARLSHSTPSGHRQRPAVRADPLPELAQAAGCRPPR